MWSTSNLQRPSLPKHLYRDVFDVKKQRRVITSNQKEEEEMQTSRIRNEKKVLSRLHNSFFSSTRTGIDPKRVPTYSPGPIYEPSVRTVSSRTYDFGSRVQDLRRELSDRRVLIELESKRMWASRGDRYAVATLPSFRSAIIISNIDASPAEIDALYESFPSDSTWYSIISTLRRESKQDRPKTTCSSASRCGSRRGNDLRPQVPFLISSKEGARSKIGSLLKFSHSD
jgi:hypothetical protein